MPGTVATALDGSLSLARGPLVVVHGKCDPRDPVTRRAIAWADAEEFSGGDKALLLGADWQAHLWAAGHEFDGWGAVTEEAIPADWDQLGHRAGPARNSLAVARGAAEAHAFPGSGERNRGTLDCAVKVARARIPLRWWCDLDELDGPEPCPVHSLPSVRTRWQQATSRLAS